MGMVFQFEKKTKVLEMDGADGYTIMYLIPLNYIFKNGTVYVVYILEK